MAQYGVSDWTAPPSGALYVTYISDPTDNMLTIRFNGTATTEAAVKTYFGGWVNEGSTTTDYEYSRGTTYGSFDTSSAPNYTIIFSINSGVKSGWPDSTLKAQYGFDDWTYPAGASYVTYYIDPDDGSLTIKFSGTAAESAVKTYFGGWVSDASTSTIFDYSRGASLAEFDITAKPYYSVTFSINTDVTTGWPADLLSQYGVTDWPAPPSGAQYITYATDPVDGSLTVTFTGTATTESAVKTYFGAWVNDGATSTVFDYSRGASIAEFITSGKPIYTIQFSVDSSVNSGWPADLMAQFGVNDWTAPPTGAQYITYFTDTDGSLLIKFNGTATTESAIKTYFGGWVSESSTSTSFDYSRGTAYASFDTSGKPTYTIQFSANTSVTGGWPVASLAQLGANDLTALSDASYIAYFVDTDGSLNIRFYGTSATETALKAYFANWTSETSSVTNVLNYSRGTAYASFDSRTKPNYILSFYPDTTAQTGAGWPASGIWNKYAAGTSAPQPGNIDSGTVGYNFKSTVQGNTTTNVLTIWFYAASGASTQTVIDSVDAALAAGGFDWDDTATGTVRAYYNSANCTALFDTGKAPYFQIVVSN